MDNHGVHKFVNQLLNHCQTKLIDNAFKYDSRIMVIKHLPNAISHKKNFIIYVGASDTFICLYNG